MILADVNVWLATVVEAHPHHDPAVRWWKEEVLPASSTVFFCRVTQLGLLRLLSNDAVMGSARRSPTEAWHDYDQLLSQPPVSFLAEPEGLDERIRAHTFERERSASLWTDAYLAAFAQEAKVRLATFDRGFRRFEELDLTVLGP